MGRAASAQAHPDICSVGGPVTHPSVSNAPCLPKAGVPSTHAQWKPRVLEFHGGHTSGVGAAMGQARVL